MTNQDIDQLRHIELMQYLINPPDGPIFGTCDICGEYQELTENGVCPFHREEKKNDSK